MPELKWDPISHRMMQGVDRGVLYLDDGPVPWSGLISVTEPDESSLDLTHYYDGRRHRLSQESGNFKATLEAFTYPQEFEPYNGFSDIRSDAPRRRFDFTYRNEIADGHEIHLVYNAHVAPSPKAWSTIAEGVDPSTFTWELLTTSIKVRGAKPCAHLVVDTTETWPDPTAELINILYGGSEAARMPTPDEVVDMFEDYTTFRIVYNDDGTAVMSGTEVEVTTPVNGEFKIRADSAFYPLEKAALVRSNWDRRRG